MRLRPALFRWLLLGSLLAASPVAADVFVIPLPEVLGTCSPGPPPAVEQRTTTFHLPGAPAVVHGASIRLTGTNAPGILRCDDGPNPGGDSPWCTVATAGMNDTPQSYWLVEQHGLCSAGTFDFTATFTTTAFPWLGIPAATWDFLADGTGEITVGGGPEGYVLGCIPQDPYPSLTFTGAWLLIDADIPVPAGASSWGRVKALYH